jgi:hypothetical protein
MVHATIFPITRYTYGAFHQMGASSTAPQMARRQHVAIHPVIKIHHPLRWRHRNTERKTRSRKGEDESPVLLCARTPVWREFGAGQGLLGCFPDTCRGLRPAPNSRHVCSGEGRERDGVWSSPCFRASSEAGGESPFLVPRDRTPILTSHGNQLPFLGSSSLLLRTSVFVRVTRGEMTTSFILSRDTIIKWGDSVQAETRVCVTRQSQDGHNPGRDGSRSRPRRSR